MPNVPPDLSDGHGGYLVAFTPVSYWVAGDYDPACLIAALKTQPGLADFQNAEGPQSAVRLDPASDGSQGFWASVPEGTDETVVEAGTAAYVAPPPPPPPPPTLQEKVAGALQQLQDQDGANPVTADQLASVIEALTS